MAPKRNARLQEVGIMHYPDAATCLLAEIPEILRRWEPRVRSAVHASQEQQGDVLRNNLANFLAAVAASLSRAELPEREANHRVVAQEHGSLRALLPAYTLGDVFREYRLLRQTILEVIDEQCDLPAAEREGIVDVLEQAMEAAASEYALVQQAAERQRGEEARDQLNQLTEAGKEKTETTSLIVHDLRSPLTCFLIGLQTLEASGHLDKDELELVNIAVDGGHTLLRMINDILDVSKSDAGKLTLDFQVMSAAELINGALDEIRPLAKEKGVALTQHGAFSLPEFIGDADKLGRTLVNLLSNAVKFTPAGGSVDVEAHLGEQRQMTISVTDTGEGIPEDDCDRVFESFVQLGTRSPNKKASSGLGLRFCRVVVEAHGGLIRVDSKLGTGSTFSFAIPASLAASGVVRAGAGVLAPATRQ